MNGMTQGYQENVSKDDPQRMNNRGALKGSQLVLQDYPAAYLRKMEGVILGKGSEPVPGGVPDRSATSTHSRTLQ